MGREPLADYLTGMTQVFAEHFDVEIQHINTKHRSYSVLRVACVFRLWVVEEAAILAMQCQGYGIFVNRYSEYGAESFEFPLEDPKCFDKAIAAIRAKLKVIDAEILERGIFHCGLLEARKALLESLDES